MSFPRRVPLLRHAATAVLSLTLIIVLPGCTSATSRPTATANPAASPTTSPTTTTRSVPAAADTVWPYYAELNPSRGPAYSTPLEATIRNTDTATVVATVGPPQPYQTFALVTGTDKPDLWLVGAQPWHPKGWDNSAQPVTLFTLAFDPVSKRATLTRLPIPPFYAKTLVGNALVSDMPSPVDPDQLAAVGLSPDGTRVAVIMTTPRAFEVRVYTVPTGAVRTWSQPVTVPPPLPHMLPPERYFSLTWLDDSRTLAVGYQTAPDPAAMFVAYLDTTRPGGELAKASRMVVLSFPKAKPPLTFKGPFPPNGCTGPPIATSDGQTVLCSGLAAVPMNNAGATEVGVWFFSARTGKLTGSWDKHQICCALAAGNFPAIVWAASQGQLFIASGIGAPDGGEAAWGEQLFVRAPDGQRRQIPWQGIYMVPNTLPPDEPPVAW